MISLTRRSALHLGTAGRRWVPLPRSVIFDLAVSTAQQIDNTAGPLMLAGATGGPRALATQPFFIGINSSVAEPQYTAAAGRIG
jgi:hypothetical protein